VSSSSETGNKIKAERVFRSDGAIGIAFLLLLFVANGIQKQQKHE
jgi:hypothetical protein